MSPSSAHPPVTAAVTRLTGGPDDAPPLHALLGDFVRRWQSGQRPLVEDVLALHPGLADQPIVLKLVQEEQRLRQLHGVPLPHAEFLRRFPRWAAQLDILLTAAPTPRDGPDDLGLPAVGDRLGEFELLAELGRGAAGVVFVAAQAALADRPVVLKITPCRGQEHLSLARLQHTNIVPLYGVERDAARDLRVLVMPYFGGTTLAQALDVLRPLPPARRSGQHLLDVLDQVEARAALRCPVQGPARQLLARLSWTRAVCWIGAALADALDYAHQRGLVHLDVKPANVLLGNDGQPMLLDFHLARPPTSAGDPAPALVGGTLAYMPREQHEAMAAVRANRPVPADLDGRADLYALAATLTYALGGPLPPGAAPLEQLNPDVSPGLSDVLGRCLAREAGDRYPSAAELAADLRRHLGDQPLVGVANRSLRERWRKWRQRRPYSVALATMGVAVVCTLAAVGLSTWSGRREREHLARTALEEGRAHLRGERPELARPSLRRGLEFLNGHSFASELRGELLAEDRRADAVAAQLERRRRVAELRTLVEQVRFLYGADATDDPRLRALAEQCRRTWEQRGTILDRLGDEPRVRADLLELAILTADLQVSVAPDQRRLALRVLDEAAAQLGSATVLQRERQRQALALGLADVAAQAARAADATALRTAWDHYALARLVACQATLTGFETVVVEILLDRACGLEPGGFWPHLVRGQHCYRLGRHAEAVAAFSVCVGAAPREPAALFNRALAAAALGQEHHALGDFETARQLDPALGPRRAVLLYNLAGSCLARGERDAARRHLEAACRVDGQHVLSRQLLRQLSPR